MEIIFLSTWLILSFVAASVAGNKGRSFGGVLFLSLILSPLIGLIVAFAMAPNSSAIEAEKVASGQSKKCPFCAEVIKSEAIVCRFCGKDQPANKELPKGSSEPVVEVFDEVAFQEYKRERIAADEAANFFSKQGLKNYENEEWWRSEFKVHQKTKANKVI